MRPAITPHAIRPTHLGQSLVKDILALGLVGDEEPACSVGDELVEIGVEGEAGRPTNAVHRVRVRSRECQRVVG